MADYEEANERLTQPFAERALDGLALRPGEFLLDVAAGTGGFALEAARRGADATAVDFAPQMVKRVRERATALELKNVTAQVMDAENLAFPDETFDVVGSSFGIMFFKSPERGLSEMRRVLKPRGRCAVTVWSEAERMELLRLMGASLRAAVPGWEPPGPPLLVRFTDPRALEDLLGQAGFDDVEIATVPGSWRFPSVDVFLAKVDRIAPRLRAIFNNLTASETRAVRGELRRRLEERFGDSSVALNVEGHIAWARK